MEKGVIKESGKSHDMKRIKERSKKSPEQAFSPMWKVKEKLTLINGLKEYGLTDVNKIAEMIGTKDANQIRIFIRNRRMTLIRKINKERRLNNEVRKKANIEQWYQIVNKEMCVRYRTNDSSILFSEIFSAASDSEPHIKPKNEFEPDIAKIYRYISYLLAGDYPGDLRPIDAMFVLSLLKSLGSFIHTEKFVKEKELYSKFNNEKRELTLQIPPTSEEEAERDKEVINLWKPYQKTDEASIKLVKDFKRPLQFINPIHIPPCLIQEECVALRKYV